MGLKDKVLFIGHYREPSGWGKAGRGYIHALKAAGFDVAARPVKLSPAHAEIDEIILECEDTCSYGCRYLIQHLLPHQMEYSGNFEKCIGIVDLDSTNLQYTGWLDRLSLMDEVWVPNTDCQASLSKEITKPVRYIPHAFDMSVYQKEYEPLNLNIPEGVVKFYTIADLNRRKNLAAIIRAFNMAFPKDYNVALVLKVSKAGTHPKQIYEEVSDFCNKIKAGMRIYKDIGDYHNEIIMPESLKEEDIYRLHKSCDIYLSASYGEAFCIPAFEAAALGNRVIAPDVGGPKDYIHEDFKIPGRYEPVFGMMDTFENLFTSREQWFNIDINTMVNRMRFARNLASDKKRSVRPPDVDFSYEAVGSLISNALGC